MPMHAAFVNDLHSARRMGSKGMRESPTTVRLPLDDLLGIQTTGYAKVAVIAGAHPCHADVLDGT